MAKNNSSTAGKKSSFLKILWWVLTPILITLIFFGTRSMIPKKEVGGVVKKTTSSLSKFVPAKPKEEDVLIKKNISKSLSKSPCAVLSRLRIVEKNNPPEVIKSWIVPCRIKKLTETEIEIVRIDEKNKEIPGTKRVGFRELSDTPDYYTGHWQDGKNKGEFWTDLEYGKGEDSDKVVRIVGYENKNGGQFDVKVVIK